MSFLYIWLFLCLLLQCAAQEPGVVVLDRRNIKEGGSVNITCRMNPKLFRHENSHDLRFNGSETGFVPKSEITILNDTTIVYTINNASVRHSQVYLCIAKQFAINRVELSVGHPPAKVTDFSCRSFDFRYMVCQFTRPENKVYTKYTLNYTAQSPNYLQSCPLEAIGGQQMICNVTVEKSNYRLGYDTFNFILHAENDLGSNKQSIRIMHYENVVPQTPQFQVQGITTHSADLQWELIHYSYYKGHVKGCVKGLEYQVFLQPAHLNTIDYTSNATLSQSDSNFRLILHDLPYAYYDYDVSVRLRVTLQKGQISCMQNNGSTWSNAFNQTFRTLPAAPYDAPTTDVGSFYIETTETSVRLYWHQVPTYYHNAKNFHYVIESVRRNGVKINVKPVENSEFITDTSVSFPWHRDNVYEFYIKSRNALGDSISTSYIKVPAMSEKLYKQSSPEWIRTIYHPNNHSYSLSWNPPLNMVDLVNYTVFWCQNINALQNECKDTIHFKTLDKNMTEYFTNVTDWEHTLNFAVSANYRNFTTGMRWTMCVVEEATDLIKLEPESGFITSRTIEIKWSLDNLCSSLPEGFVLNYCRVDPGHPSVCLGNENSTLIDKTKRKHVLKDLKPFTNYKIEMYMFSRLKNGTSSVPKIVTTEEDAPSQPRNLKYHEITSESAWISWQAPEESNGVIRSYDINFGDGIAHIYCGSEKNICTTGEEEMRYELSLRSYKRYKVFVTAYTQTHCSSMPSNDVHFRTLIGFPSRPRYMKTNPDNSSVLEWLEPEHQAGRNDYYEVAVTVWHSNKLKRRRISGVYNSLSCAIKIPVCLDSQYKYTVEVRAINVVALQNEIDYRLYNRINLKDYYVDEIYYTGNDDLICVGVTESRESQESKVEEFRNKDIYFEYRSNWEKGTEYGCADNTKLSRITTIALIVVITSLTAMTTFYVARVKYLQWSGIKVVMPGDLGVPEHGKSMGKLNLGAVTSNNIKMNSPGVDYHHLSKESLFQPESHHLLAPNCHDVGYMGVAAGAVNHLTPCSMGSSGYNDSQKSCEYMQAEVLTSLNSDGNSSAETIVTPLEESGYQLMKQPAAVKNPNPDGYIQPQNILTTKLPTQSGYVKPNNIFHWPTTPPSSDYVQPQMLQKQSIEQVPSYTTLQSLDKSDAPQLATLDNIMQPISGYVTHKQLSVFGKQQQQHQQQQMQEAEQKYKERMS